MRSFFLPESLYELNINKETAKKVESLVKDTNLTIHVFDDVHTQIECVIRDTILRFIETEDYNKEMDKVKGKKEKKKEESPIFDPGRRRSTFGDIFSFISPPNATRKKEEKKPSEVIQKFATRKKNSVVTLDINPNDFVKPLKKTGNRISFDELNPETEEEEQRDFSAENASPPVIDPLNQSKRRSTVSVDEELSSPQFENFSFGEQKPSPTFFKRNRKNQEAPSPTKGGFIRGLFTTKSKEEEILHSPNLRSRNTKTPESMDFIESPESRSQSLGETPLTEQKIGMFNKLFKPKKEEKVLPIITPRNFSDTSEDNEDDKEYKLEDYKMI